jgi:transcriptional regulator PpsR
MAVGLTGPAGQRTAKDASVNSDLIGRMPSDPLPGYGPELAETLVGVCSDVALIVDLDGTVRSAAVRAGSPTPQATTWVGRSWVETASPRTRGKLVRLLGELAVEGGARHCEVEHPLPGTDLDVPVAWTALRLGDHGPLIAAGKDLRAIAEIQQRFVRTQQEMERDYGRRRAAESRYRNLFEATTEPELVVDAATLRVLEGNRAAADATGLAPSALAGRDAGAVFDADSRPLVGALFAQAIADRRSAQGRARLAGRPASFELGVVPFRSAGSELLLIRLRAVDTGPADAA